MKTLNAVLVIMMLSGQLSFGTGNETCCPDTTSVELATQVQLDRLQVESNEIKPIVPSLQPVVLQKFNEQHATLNRMQTETEVLDIQPGKSVAQQVNLKLGINIPENKSALAESEKF